MNRSTASFCRRAALTLKPSQTHITVIAQNKVRRLNLNQRRFGLASFMAVPHAAGRG